MRVLAASSKIHGTGVFSTGSISRGHVVLRLEDSLIVNEAHPLRPDLGEDPDHQDWLPDETFVLQGEPDRYINHSCDPNAFVYSVARTRFVLALRDIRQGDELTYDYALNAIGGDLWECRCGVSRCRGKHKCDFFELPTDRQLEYLQILDPWFARVHAVKIYSLLDRHCKHTGADDDGPPLTP